MSSELKGLIENKKEYTTYFLDLVIEPFVQEFQDIYDRYAIKSSRVLQTFQQHISKIPEWNHIMIREFYERVKEQTGCTFLPDLIRAIFTTYVKLHLMSNHMEDRLNQVKVKVPTMENFMHRCLIACARVIWKNPYLYYHSVRTLERQHNRNQVEEHFRKAIMSCIRSCLPLEQILSMYKPEEGSADSESDTKEKSEEQSESETAEETDDESPSEAEEESESEAEEESEEEDESVSEAEDESEEEADEEAEKESGSEAEHESEDEADEKAEAEAEAEANNVFVSEVVEDSKRGEESEAEEVAYEESEAGEEPPKDVEEVKAEINDVSEKHDEDEHEAEAEALQSEMEEIPNLDSDADASSDEDAKNIDVVPIIEQDSDEELQFVKTDIDDETKRAEAATISTPSDPMKVVPLQNMLINRTKLHKPKMYHMAGDRERVKTNAFY